MTVTAAGVTLGLFARLERDPLIFANRTKSIAAGLLRFIIFRSMGSQ
jgi:hypothetical protein